MAITENSQSTANNTSNVTVSVTVYWSGGSYNHVGCWLGVNVDGESDGATVKINPSKTNSGSEVIYSKSFDISHNSDGTKTLKCSAYLETGISSGTVEASANKTLTTIARSATLDVDDGTLGTQQTITIDSDSNSLTYTITYSCGSKSGTICTKSSSKSIKWTPPLALAEANTTGGSVTVKLSLTTYSGSASVGTDSESIQCAIPASVKPSFTAEFTDAAGYKDDYGTFIQSLSKLHTVVSASSLYGATIKAYKITANGETFTTAECTTGVLTSSGDITVQVVVTDSRDRTAQTNFTINVTSHTLPLVSSLSVHRCDSSGKENDQGAYVQVTFSASADPFDSKNTVAYKLEYKKSSASSYTVVNLTSYNNNFAISGKTYIFSADTGSSYDVRITVTDAFSVISKSTTASTAATIMHFKANGKGLGLGKVAEVDNAVDVGWKFQMNGHTVTGLPAPTSDSDAVPKSYVTEQMANVISLSDVYPVGAIYISTVSTSPATLFGGSWTQLTDRFLLGAGTTYTAGKTGGAATHTLTVDEMPRHNHWGVYRPDWYLHDETGQASGVSNGASNNQLFTDNTGGGGAHNNMPPYLVVYMWKRIA